MGVQVLINDLSIEAQEFYATTDERTGRRKIGFQFEVNHNDYHRVTTLLYENHFKIAVPDKDIEFTAEISNYYTSITNLYEKNTIGLFTLELIEKS